MPQTQPIDRDALPPLKFKHRYEVKYRISEVEAAHVQQFIAPYVTADEYALAAGGYEVNSLYLDSPDLRLFHSADTGEMNRIKLRLRTYTDDPDQPVFAEIKRRLNLVIKKQRTILKRNAVQCLLDGEVSPGMLYEAPAGLEELEAFIVNLMRLQARPALQVCYRRQAYFDALDPSTRLTIDYNIRCRPASPRGWSIDIGGDSWSPYPERPNILEIKYNVKAPHWVHALIAHADLLRESYSKYVEGIHTLENQGIYNSMAGGCRA